VESSQRVKFHPASLLWGRVWTSGLFGGYKGRSELPDLVDRCIKGVSSQILQYSLNVTIILINNL